MFSCLHRVSTCLGLADVCTGQKGTYLRALKSTSPCFCVRHGAQGSRAVCWGGQKRSRKMASLS